MKCFVNSDCRKPFPAIERNDLPPEIETKNENPHFADFRIAGNAYEEDIINHVLEQDPEKYLTKLSVQIEKVKSEAPGKVEERNFPS